MTTSDVEDLWREDIIPEVIEHLSMCGSGGPPPHNFAHRCPIACLCPCHLVPLDMVAMVADRTARRP